MKQQLRLARGRDPIKSYRAERIRRLESIPSFCNRDLLSIGREVDSATVGLVNGLFYLFAITLWKKIISKMQIHHKANTCALLLMERLHASIVLQDGFSITGQPSR
ncbi:hypothetical protein TNCV_1099111 [Trichonephila clavipes]|nr:hypothetical protein TNCV_1099111 [Trichonephila clavipes]